MTTDPNFGEDGGFSRVAARWSWPENTELLDVAPFTWSLDGGGRELIHAVIAGRPSGVLVEIGSFMGGAARAWLQTFPELRCICVDPWGENLVQYVHNLTNVDWAVQSYGVEQIQTYARVLKAHGPMAVVRNNLREFGDRCVLIQAGVPEVFEMLSECQLRPDIVFLDALKRRDEFIGTHESFPDAIVTGDDWSWRSPTGEFPVREYASVIAKLRKARIYASRATFVISEKRHSLVLDDNQLFSTDA